MTYTDPIPRRKLSSDVTDRLLSRINGGEFVPGSRLPSERALMESFQVGRPAIREALQNLQRMGLIQITHGESARVVAPTARTILDQIAGTARHMLSTAPKTLDDLKDARLFFEVGMARLAAARATADDVIALEERIDRQADAGDDIDAFLRADIAFHRGVAAISGNPIFMAVSEAMLEWLLEYHVGLIRKDGRELKTLAEHRLIAERIGAHDVEGSAAAMLAHLTRAADLYDSVKSPRRR
jgi:GntR family transcriptional regulator, sialic acid-inducible nan operon repressor